MKDPIIYKRDGFEADGSVKFRALPGRFFPKAGKSPKLAREAYKEIANCGKCRNGMAGTILCWMHKTQLGLD